MKLTFLVLVVGAALVVQVPGPLIVSSASTAEWTHSGLNTLGAPTTLLDAELALTLSAVTDITVPGVILKSVRVPGKQGVNTAALATLFAGQADGQKKLWVRVFSQAGVPSGWAAPVVITLNNTVPATPTAVKVTP